MHTTFSALALAGTMLATPAVAEVIEVRPGQSIQAAVNRARPGDTVAVRAGTYHETVYARMSGVRLVSADGTGAAHIVSDRTPLFVQGGSGNEIRGFALTGGRNGNGLQIGGTVRNFARDYTIADNIIRNAGLDGIKVHQATGFRLTGNVVENAGTGSGRNADGGIDFVAVTHSEVSGNTVRRTGGNTCMMLKGGSTGNRLTGNAFGGCKDAVHVGGLTSGGFEAPGWGGRQAYANTISGNNLCGERSAVYLFDGERRRQDNTIGNNSCSGTSVGPIRTAAAPPIDLDAARIQGDITTHRNNGLNDSAIRYIYQLEGITIPDDVLSGNKTVEAAIADGSLRRNTTAGSVSPPPPSLPPSPEPDLTPRGSSADGWSPRTILPTLEQMRRAITSVTRPPNC